MAWTAPRTWVAGELVTASLLNTHIRDNELYLKASPTFDGSVTVTGDLTAANIGVGSGLTVTGTIAATGGQIGFPATQNPSAGANTLDDYEEGTWTPTIGGSGGQSGQAYSGQAGTYVKIGQFVHAAFDVTLSTLGTITGTAEVKGLPFTGFTGITQPSSPLFFANLTTSVSGIFGYVAASTTLTLVLVPAAGGTSLTAVAQADLANTSRLIGVVSYRANG